MERIFAERINHRPSNIIFFTRRKRGFLFVYLLVFVKDKKFLNEGNILGQYPFPLGEIQYIA